MKNKTHELKENKGIINVKQEFEKQKNNLLLEKSKSIQNRKIDISEDI